MLSSLVSNGQQPTSDQSEQVVPWWSFTKTILAVTALSLVRDGRVGLDTPIPGQPFTLRQLLRHEAGLADYGELADYHAAVANHEAAWSADGMMQRLDGYQTCALIKNHRSFKSTPVIMLSSKDGVFDKARGRMVGSEEYLTKPFTKDQLLQAVTQFGIKGE